MTSNGENMVYEIYEVPAGVAVADIRTGEIINVWKTENRFMAVQFADALNTLNKMNNQKIVTA